MNDQFRQLVIETLARGDDLPADWESMLFPPQKREYELVYGGKQRREDIIAETMAVPLQQVSTFGGSDDDWRNMLILGDNLQVLKALVDKKETGDLRNADGTPGVRLIYIDPPFATKKEFRGSADQKAYQDKLIGAQFIEFLRRRLVLLYEVLSDDGVIFLHLDTKKSHYLKVVMDEVFGEANFRNEIIWKRQSAHNDSNQCGAVHDTIFFYTKTGTWTWNEVLTPPSPDYIEQFFDQVEPETGRIYARGDLTAGGLSGGGYDYEFRGIRRTWRCPPSTMEQYEAENRLHWPKSAGGVPRLKRYLDEFEGVSLQDVWSDIRVIHNRSPERVGYPTQKPETLVERIIRAACNPGDLVLDCFAGSGTTCAVAEKLNRRWVAIDCGKLAIYTIQKRMLNLKTEVGQKGKPLAPKAFTLFNAGLYDFSTLRQLPWKDWRFFALKLFDCKDEPHEIGGLKLDGKRQGASVLVFNHVENPGQGVDEESIHDIHAAIGNKIGSRFFIVAPRNTFDFQQDYLDLDGVRYYALRIPYSFINELHRREFSALQQPADEIDVNAIVDAVGFDFIKPPKVEWRATTDERCIYLQINEFESRVNLRGKETKGSLETFSMLMLDFNYDGRVFDLDKVYYSHEFADNQWQVPIPVAYIGNQLMVIFVDVFGNEARVLITREQIGLDPTDTVTEYVQAELTEE